MANQAYTATHMSFIAHLEKLRWHIIRSLCAIFLFSIAAFSAKKLVFHTLILGPTRLDFWTYRMLYKLGTYMNISALNIEHINFTLQSRKMTGQFTMHITSSLVIGLIAAFPYIFWEIWRFIKPGLYTREKNTIYSTTFAASSLFWLGVLFSYFIIIPLTVNFLANYQLDPSIHNEFDITSYITTFLTLIIVCALMFQLPIVVYFLAKEGIITAIMMSTYRRHAIIFILIISAIITPPDVMSQLLIALPLMILYECSIWIAKMAKNKYKN